MELLQLPHLNSTFKLVVSSATENIERYEVPEDSRIDVEAATGTQSDTEIILQQNISNLIDRRPQYRNIRPQILETIQHPPATLSVSLLTLALIDVLSIRSTESAAKMTIRWSPKTSAERVPRMTSEILPELLQGFWNQNLGRTSDWTLRAFSWIIKAKRPLTLGEISVALSIRPDPETNEILYSEDEILRDPVTDLQQAFGSLIRIQNEVVSFVHKSLQNLLEEDHKRNCNDMKEKCLLCSDADSIIARSCLAYLSKLWTQYPHQNRGRGSAIGPHSLPRALSFEAYAVQYWPMHYRSAKTGELEGFQQLFRDDNLIMVWSRLFQECQNEPNIGNDKDPLSVASGVGCDTLVSILLENPTSDVEKALRSAVEAGHESTTDLLLSHARFARESMAMSIAAAYGRERLMPKLVEKGYSLSASDGNGMLPLHIASEHGNTSIVKTLLRSTSTNIDVDARNRHGHTALHLASRFGHTGVMRLLLDTKADINALAHDGSTPLHLACALQQPEAVAMLVKRKAEIDEVDNRGKTPLHLAAATGRVDIIEILLKHVQDEGAILELVKNRDTAGCTPLHSAAASGHVEVVKKILDRTSDPDLVGMTDSRGRVPLHLAADEGHLDVVEILLRESTAELGNTDDDLANPIHLAVTGGHQRVVERLCHEHQQQRKSLNVFNLSKYTPLHIACKHGNTSMVRSLLNAGATAEIAGCDNETPLHLASRHGFGEVVRLLLDASANPIAQNGSGTTPLHLASQKGHLDLVKMLLRVDEHLDERVNVTNDQGQTPIHLAAEGGHADVMKALKDAGANLGAKDKQRSTLLHFVCEGGSNRALEMLLDPDGNLLCPVNDPNELGQTPLHIAAKAGKLDIVKKLNDRRADQTVLNKDNQTPLELTSDQLVVEELWDSTIKTLGSLQLVQLMRNSASQGHLNILKRLLKMEIPPRGIDTNEKTPLHLAAEKGQLEAVRLLLKTDGFASEDQDEEGRTPLSYAAECGHEGIVSELIQRGHGTNLVDRSGRSPVSYAAEKGHNSTIRCLVQAGAEIERTEGTTPTPIWYAAEAGLSKTAQLLLDLGADPNIQGNDDKTVLHLAAREDHWETAEVILQCKRFTMGDSRDRLWRTPMYIASYYGQAKTLNVLLVAGLKKEIPDEDEWRPIHVAYDSLAVTRLLLRAKVDIDARTNAGWTALSLAIVNKFHDVASELLENGANPLIANNDGGTALHAVAEGEPSVFLVRFLIRKAESFPGFDINVRDNLGRSPFWKAIENGNVEMAEILLTRKDVQVLALDYDDRSPLWGGIGSHQHKTVELLLKHMNDTQWDAWLAAGETRESLFLHTLSQHDETLCEIFKNSVEANIDGHHEGLFREAMCDNPDLARFLLHRKADPEKLADPGKLDEHGWTLGWLIFAHGVENNSEDFRPEKLPEPNFKRPISWSEEDKSKNIVLEAGPDSESTERLLVKSE
jgi:ankyrin repeat protein/predicted DNA-binding protein (UPF0251 family)